MGSGFKSAYLQNGAHGTLVFVRNDAPTSGRYNGTCPAGGLVLDMGGGVLYQNTGTLDATTFAVLGSVIPAGAVAPATINFAALPTADPHVAGLLWVNSGVVTRSAG